MIKKETTKKGYLVNKMATLVQNSFREIRTGNMITFFALENQNSNSENRFWKCTNTLKWMITFSIANDISRNIINFECTSWNEHTMKMH